MDNSQFPSISQRRKKSIGLVVSKNTSLMIPQQSPASTLNFHQSPTTAQFLKTPSTIIPAPPSIAIAQKIRNFSRRHQSVIPTDKTLSVQFRFKPKEQQYDNFSQTKTTLFTPFIEQSMDSFTPAPSIMNKTSPMAFTQGNFSQFNTTVRTRNMDIQLDLGYKYAYQFLQQGKSHVFPNQKNPRNQKVQIKPESYFEIHTPIESDGLLQRKRFSSIEPSLSGMNTPFGNKLKNSPVASSVETIVKSPKNQPPKKLSPKKGTGVLIPNYSITAHKTLYVDPSKTTSKGWNPHISGLTASGLTPQSQLLLESTENLQHAYKVGLKNYPQISDKMVAVYVNQEPQDEFILKNIQSQRSEMKLNYNTRKTFGKLSNNQQLIQAKKRFNEESLAKIIIKSKQAQLDKQTSIYLKRKVKPGQIAPIVKVQKQQVFNIKNYKTLDIDQPFSREAVKPKDYDFRVAKGLRNDISPSINKLEADSSLNNIYSYTRFLRNQNTTIQNNLNFAEFERLRLHLEHNSTFAATKFSTNDSGEITGDVVEETTNQQYRHELQAKLHTANKKNIDLIQNCGSESGLSVLQNQMLSNIDRTSQQHNMEFQNLSFDPRTNMHPSSSLGATPDVIQRQAINVNRDILQVQSPPSLSSLSPSLRKIKPQF